MGDKRKYGEKENYERKGLGVKGRDDMNEGPERGERNWSFRGNEDKKKNEGKVNGKEGRIESERANIRKEE